RRTDDEKKSTGTFANHGVVRWNCFCAIRIRDCLRPHELRERAAALCRTSATARSIKEQLHPTHYSVQPGFANVAQPSKHARSLSGPILAMEKRSRWEHVPKYRDMGDRDQLRPVSY